MNVEALWVKRFQRFAQERVNYLVRIAGGFLFAFVLITAVGFHYYHAILEGLPGNFPGEIVIAILYAMLVTRGEFRTWTEAADLLYLTPLEHKMGTYFARCLFYNGTIQVLGLLLATVIIYPLYAYVVSPDPYHFLPLLIVLLLLKGWNLHSKWQAIKQQDQKKTFLHMVIRFFANGLMIYGLVQAQFLLLLIGIVVGILVIRYDGRLKNKPIYWYKLISMENKLNSRFYTFASFFIDIPHLEGRVKERKILPLLTKVLPFKSANSFHYLYIKMFLRHPSSSMIIRLMIIGAIVTTIIPDPYWALLAYSLFLMVSAMQLMSFWGTYESQFWDQLYPLPDQTKRDSFLLSTFIVLVMEGIIMMVPSFFGDRAVSSTILLAVVGVIFAYVYVYLIRKKRINSLL
jgi:ABC-2 type transport system permease protein